MSVLLCAGLSAGAVLVALVRPAPSPRLRRLSLSVRTTSRADPETGRASQSRAPMAACVAGGLALVLVVGGVTGVVLALVLVLVGPRQLQRLEPTAVREQEATFTADLPLALELLASCLSGGAALVVAVHAVGRAVPGPCGRCFVQVAAALELGSSAAEAWGVLADAGPIGASAARSLVRAAEGGAPVAVAVGRAAADARLASAGRSTRAARRAGVLAVAPLGLCFLPAFVLLGVVPAVVGLAGPLLATL